MSSCEGGGRTKNRTVQTCSRISCGRFVRRLILSCNFWFRTWHRCSFDNHGWKMDICSLALIVLELHEQNYLPSQNVSACNQFFFALKPSRNPRILRQICCCPSLAKYWHGSYLSFFLTNNALKRSPHCKLLTVTRIFWIPFLAQRSRISWLRSPSALGWIHRHGTDYRQRLGSLDVNISYDSFLLNSIPTNQLNRTFPWNVFLEWKVYWYSSDRFNEWTSWSSPMLTELLSYRLSLS